MKLLFLTACFYPNQEPIQLLLDSCKRVGITMTPYGVGREYGADPVNAKMALLSEVLRLAKDYTHVLYTDGADALIVQPEGRIRYEYENLGKPPCLISAEAECAPVQRIGDRFPDPGTPYRYPCAGGFMGGTAYLAFKLQLLMSRYLGTPLDRNDQAYWSMGWADELLPGAKIDSHCRIFQTMSGGAMSHVVARPSVRNTLTGSFPAVIHFNGRTQGIETFAKEIGL